jgi:cytochrome c-type biogenesis protein CcmE
MAKVSDDPAFHNVGVKVSGKVVPGTYEQGEGELVHLFTVQDLEHTDVTFSAMYTGVLPDTFTDDTEVVLEGRFGEDRVFQATTLLTKCGSRYEASPEELAEPGIAG